MTWLGRVWVNAAELAELSRLLEDAEAHCSAVEATGGHRGEAWARYVQLRAAIVEAQRQVKRWLGLERPFGRGSGVDFSVQDPHRL